MKQGRIQNLTGGYVKAGYDNVKISQVKDYFLIHGKNYAMPNVFKELAEVEQYIEQLPSEKSKKNTVIIPFTVADESELYGVLYEKTKEKSNVVDRPTQIAVLAILQRYRQRYYNDSNVSELMPT